MKNENEPTLTCSEVVERLHDVAIAYANEHLSATEFHNRTTAILHSWRERRVQELEDGLRKIRLSLDMAQISSTAPFIAQHIEEAEAEAEKLLAKSEADQEWRSQCSLIKKEAGNMEKHEYESSWTDRDMLVGGRLYKAGTVTVIDILDHAASAAKCDKERESSLEAEFNHEFDERTKLIVRVRELETLIAKRSLSPELSSTQLDTTKEKE